MLLKRFSCDDGGITTCSYNVGLKIVTIQQLNKDTFESMHASFHVIASEDVGLDDTKPHSAVD